MEEKDHVADQTYAGYKGMYFELLVILVLSHFPMLEECNYFNGKVSFIHLNFSFPHPLLFIFFLPPKHLKVLSFGLKRQAVHHTC